MFKRLFCGNDKENNYIKYKVTFYYDDINKPSRVIDIECCEGLTEGEIIDKAVNQLSIPPTKYWASVKIV